jgi:hypothetical protein
VTLIVVAWLQSARAWSVLLPSQLCVAAGEQQRFVAAALAPAAALKKLQPADV